MLITFLNQKANDSPLFNLQFQRSRNLEAISKENKKKRDVSNIPKSKSKQSTTYNSYSRNPDAIPKERKEKER